MLDPVAIAGICSFFSATISSGVAYLAGNRNQVSSILKQQDDRITALLEDLKQLKASTDERITTLERLLGEERVLNARLDDQLKTSRSNADYLKRERDEARDELKKLKEQK